MNATLQCLCNIEKLVDYFKYNKHLIEIVRNDFAGVILDKAQSIGIISHDVNVLPITSEEFGAKAKRPADSRMNCDSFAKTFRRNLPDWREYLEETLRGL